jgi:hypothetical protein
VSRKSNDWAWNQPIKPASMKLTLLAMADRTNEEHECWPSYTRLEKDTGLNKKTIMKNIHLLVDQGLIEDTGKRKGSTGQVKVFKFTFKDTQKRNSTKNGHVTKEPENGTLTIPKNGYLKDTQKRVSEPPSLLNHPIEPPKERQPGKSTQTWDAYSEAYFKRYGVSPLRGAKVNKLLCSLVDQIGLENAPHVAAYYVTLDDQWYQKKSHDVPTLIQNAQGIFTQWATGTNKTSRDYQQNERRSSLANSRDEAMKMLEAKGK